MRLTSFAVQNYRGFADRAEVELRPLTLLFGYNSAGKSALLRWLPIVAASTEPDATSALALDVDAARRASFDDLLSRYSGSDKLSFGLRWQDSTSARDELRVELRLLWEARQQQQIVEHMRVWQSVGSDVHEVDASWELDLDAPIEQRQYAVRVDGGAPGALELAFGGLVPRPEAFDGTAAGSTMRRLAEQMLALRRNVHWLNAVRTVPERTKDRGPQPRRLGSNGTLAGDFLAHDRLGSGRVLATVSAWYEQATAHSLDVQLHAVAGDERFSLVLKPTEGRLPIRIPLPDTGEGMAQVLPVIVLGALARHGLLGDHPLMMIEHPELHLHPAVHADLAGYFCALARDLEGATTVLETHSENVLLRVQLAIARGELDPNRVIVHWVRNLSEGPAVVESITFDDVARPQGDWPPGVFSSDIHQARELLALRRKRGAP